MYVYMVVPWCHHGQLPVDVIPSRNMLGDADKPIGLVRYVNQSIISHASAVGDEYEREPPWLQALGTDVQYVMTV